LLSILFISELFPLYLSFKYLACSNKWSKSSICYQTYYLYCLSAITPSRVHTSNTSRKYKKEVIGVIGTGIFHTQV